MCHLKQARPCYYMLALHINELLNGEALVVREVHQQRLRHNLQVLFDSASSAHSIAHQCQRRTKLVRVNKETIPYLWRHALRGRL